MTKRCHREFIVKTVWRCERPDGHEGFCLINRKEPALSTDTKELPER